MPDARLLAVSDLHVAYPENRAVVEQLRAGSPDDWLIVAGDVAETVRDIRWTLGVLREKFGKVIWTPGNHELWTAKNDPVQLRGDDRYRHLVEVCRQLDVVTPEDPYPVWQETVTVAPLFLLYDYSFLPPGCRTAQEGLAYAHETGIVCTDELFLHPDPFATRADWCAARVAYSEQRLEALTTATVLVNHWPLVREPTRILRYPEFAQWCGTDKTADWHIRFRAAAAVYGHLHIPRTTHYDGVRFEEVSLGYPREWQPRGQNPPSPVRTILP
jgi:3',5'-cyclic AMP phosphodiesterase CpdA